MRMRICVCVCVSSVRCIDSLENFQFSKLSITKPLKHFNTNRTYSIQWNIHGIVLCFIHSFCVIIKTDQGIRTYTIHMTNKMPTILKEKGKKNAEKEKQIRMMECNTRKSECGM